VVHLSKIILHCNFNSSVICWRLCSTHGENGK